MMDPFSDVARQQTKYSRSYHTFYVLEFATVLTIFRRTTAQFKPVRPVADAVAAPTSVSAAAPQPAAGSAVHAGDGGVAARGRGPSKPSGQSGRGRGGGPWREDRGARGAHGAALAAPSSAVSKSSVASATAATGDASASTRARILRPTAATMRAAHDAKNDVAPEGDALAGAADPELHAYRLAHAEDESNFGGVALGGGVSRGAGDGDDESVTDHDWPPRFTEPHMAPITLPYTSAREYYAADGHSAQDERDSVWGSRSQSRGDGSSSATGQTGAGHRRLASAGVIEDSDEDDGAAAGAAAARRPTQGGRGASGARDVSVGRRGDVAATAATAAGAPAGGRAYRAQFAGHLFVDVANVPPRADATHGSLGAAPAVVEATPNPALHEGSLLHFVLPSTLPVPAHLATTGDAAASKPRVPLSSGLDPDAGDDPDADTSNQYRARMAAMPAGVIGKVRHCVCCMAHAFRAVTASNVGFACSRSFMHNAIQSTARAICTYPATTAAAHIPVGACSARHRRLAVRRQHWRQERDGAGGSGHATGSAAPR